MPQRDQWILTGPCGCPFGVMEGYLARDENEALVEFYEVSGAIRRARDRGMKVTLISFEEYTEKFYDLMHETCPH